MPDSLPRSDHAKRRSQQRGIDDDVIDVVVEYGAQVPHGGATKYYMDKRAWRRAQVGMGNAAYRKMADRLNDVYVVANDSLIITVGRLNKGMRRSKPHRTTKHPRARSDRRGKR